MSVSIFLVLVRGRLYEFCGETFIKNYDVVACCMLYSGSICIHDYIVWAMVHFLNWHIFQLQLCSSSSVVNVSQFSGNWQSVNASCCIT